MNTTASHRVAFIGIPHLALHAFDEMTVRDQHLGPVHWRLMARFAYVSAPPEARQGVPGLLRMRVVASIAADSLLGRRRPSPFFDAAVAPVVTPVVLTSHERERLRVERGSR